MKFYKSLTAGHLVTDARRRSLACTVILGLMILGGTRLLAQGITGTISGTVADPTGASRARRHGYRDADQHEHRAHGDHVG